MRVFVGATALVLAAWAALGAGPAWGGSFDVQSCGDATAGANHAWALQNNAPGTLDTGAECPPQPDAYSGLATFDHLQGSDSAPGSSASWLLTAPAGTRITSLRYHRYIGKELDDSWVVGVRLSDGTLLDGCDLPPFGDRCSQGSAGYLSGADFFSSGVLDTSSLSVGVECPSTVSVCGNGFTVHRAWAVLYASTVTLEDLQHPAVTNPAGTAWTNDGFHTGAETASFASADNAGIKRTRVVVDGVPLQTASTNWPCDYTYPVPCQDRSASYSIDTRSISDGSHTLALSAVDAADNEKTVSRTVSVDNTAPTPPKNLAVVGGEGWRDTTSFAVTWANPAGQVAPIVAADYELCGPVGCTTSRVVGPDIQQIDEVRVPLAGDHTLVVWLEDAAGNVSAANRGGPVHLRSGKEPTTNPPPTKPTDLTPPSLPRSQPRVKLTTARFAGTRLLVRGTLSKDATGTVRVTYRVHARGRTVEHRAHARPLRGVFRVSIRLSRTARRASRGTVVMRYTGDARYLAQIAHRTIARSEH